MKTKLYTFVCLLLTLGAQAGNVTLIWPRPDVGANAASYVLRWGESPTNLTASLNTTNLTANVTNLNFGVWYFDLTVIVRGQGSDPSPTVSWTNRPAAPSLQIDKATNGPTATLWMPWSGGSMVAQSALDPSGPWDNWFVAAKVSERPGVGQIGVKIYADEPRRFVRMQPE